MNSVFRNISWLTAGNAIARPLWLVFLTVICIPVLGDAGYGVFTAAMAIMAIALTFSDAGVTPYTIREVARNREDAGRFFSNLILSKAGLGVLAVGAGLGVGWLIGYEGKHLAALGYAGGYFLGLQLLRFCRAFFRAFEEMKWEAASSIVEKVVVIAIATALLLRFRTAEAVLGGMAGSMVILVVIHIYWVHRQFASLKQGLVTGSFVRSALWTALPLGLAGQLSVIYFRTDAVMVEAMIGEVAAGQYGAAYRLLEAVVLLTSMVTAAVYPRLSVLFDDRNRAGFVRLVRMAAGGLFGLGLIQLAVFFFGSTWLMDVVKSGIGVAESADALRILAFAVPFAAFNFLLSVTMSAADDQRALAWILGVAALVNLVLNVFWIPRFGIGGAASATVLTEALTASLFLWRYGTHIERLSSWVKN